MKLSADLLDKTGMEKEIESKILTLKRQRVILDRDLAHLYGVSTA